ncbi:hypothetical protein [Pelagicoccus mobilis]|uniref:Uncharacterized protein n=1 Tax=Pelagicoccus mobilis TaxID=415221 RepID=A0A934S183_9BACT|nr:hypothetical protein [Pelagicoccus mobilis]MBK1879285.1 hypothetical protein [Pelagicoccus mobilis]
MNDAKNTGKKGGWRTLGIWVTLTFVGLASAWYFLIKIASENAPEPVPLEQSK